MFFFLHHTNKQRTAKGQDRVRGSSDLTAMVDHGFMLEKKENKTKDRDEFRLTEPSPRYGRGATLSYYMCGDTSPGSRLEFIEIPTEQGGKNNKKNQVDPEKL